jgi:hypothetical protein
LTSPCPTTSLEILGGVKTNPEYPGPEIANFREYTPNGPIPEMGSCSRGVTPFLNLSL